MAPTTQKAFGVPVEKGEWKLFTDWPVPIPTPNEVLVRITAAAVNPIDAYIQKFGMPLVKTYPWICGVDGAGVVEELGSEVTTLAKGDRVFFPSGLGGTFQEYNVYPVDNVAKIPDGFSFEQAATIPVTLNTVAAGLWSHHPAANSVDFPAPWEEGGLTKFVGQPAFIVGGSSSVGQFAIQMAKLQGFSPIIVTASLRHETFLKYLGATHVIDRSLPSNEAVLAELSKIVGGKPCLYAFDTVGTLDTQRLAYDALAKGGSFVTVNNLTPDSLADRQARDGGAIRVARPFGSVQVPENKKLGEELWSRLTEWLQTGVLVPNRVEVVPKGLLGVAEASERISKKQVSGAKLIVRPHETP